MTALTFQLDSSITPVYKPLRMTSAAVWCMHGSHKSGGGATVRVATGICRIYYAQKKLPQSNINNIIPVFPAEVYLNKAESPAHATPIHHTTLILV